MMLWPSQTPLVLTNPASWLCRIWILFDVMRDLHTQPTKSLSSFIFRENKLRQTSIPAHLERKDIFSPALASQGMFINPKALSWPHPDHSTSLHQLLSLVPVLPTPPPPWVDRKTCRIWFHGRKMHCPSEAPVYTPSKMLHSVWWIFLE